MTTNRMRVEWARWPLLLIVAAALALALGRLTDSAPAPLPAPDRHPASGAPTNYAGALRLADQSVDSAERLARPRGGEWLVQEKLAVALYNRARLTGSFDDYAAAQGALNRAFAEAPAGAGPHRTQAALAFTLHRLDQSTAAIDAIGRYAVPPETDFRREMEAMRGDIALYRGQYDAAARAYAALRGEGADPALLYRQAVLFSRTGRSDDALHLVDAIERGARLPHAQFLSNLALLRGTIALQRGDREAAARDFGRADRLFSGSWLVGAHRAQMRAIAGDRAGAIAQTEAILRGGAWPEVMDMLAGFHRAQGDHARAARWAGRAGAAWRRRLAQVPEAAYGHAVEHELAFGDPARALALAQADYRARPYAGAAIALGWAWLGMNQPARALAAVQPVLRSAWVSADQHIVAAQALLLLGRGDAAEAERQAALAINPHALDRDAALIWFGH